MPIYEYACSDCSERLEKLQKISDDELKTCPKCHKDTLKKLISAAGFRLKGTGWYETDFKKGKKKNLAQSSNSNENTSQTKKPDKKVMKKNNS